MLTKIISYNKNVKNDKFFINNIKFLNNYINNSKVRIANANNTMILYIFSIFGNNSFLDFNIMS